MMKACSVPDETFTFWVTAISLLYSRDGQLIHSAFTSRISTLVDNTTYLHFSGSICSTHAKKKKKKKIILQLFMRLYGVKQPIRMDLVLEKHKRHVHVTPHWLIDRLMLLIKNKIGWRTKIWGTQTAFDA